MTEANLTSLGETITQAQNVKIIYVDPSSQIVNISIEQFYSTSESKILPIRAAAMAIINGKTYRGKA